MLTVFLDSESINSLLKEKYELIEDLLIRDPYLFKIRRRMCDVYQGKIKEIPTLQKIEVRDFKQNVLDNMYQNLSFHPKNSCQEQFFYSLEKLKSYRRQAMLSVPNSRTCSTS
jgi:hypothetical protein